MIFAIAHNDGYFFIYTYLNTGTSEFYAVNRITGDKLSGTGNISDIKNWFKDEDIPKYGLYYQVSGSSHIVTAYDVANRSRILLPKESFVDLDQLDHSGVDMVVEGDNLVINNHDKSLGSIFDIPTSNETPQVPTSVRPLPGGKVWVNEKKGWVNSVFYAGKALMLLPRQ